MQSADSDDVGMNSLNTSGRAYYVHQVYKGDLFEGSRARVLFLNTGLLDPKRLSQYQQLSRRDYHFSRV